MTMKPIYNEQQVEYAFFAHSNSLMQMLTLVSLLKTSGNPIYGNIANILETLTENSRDRFESEIGPHSDCVVLPIPDDEMENVGGLLKELAKKE